MRVYSIQMRRDGGFRLITELSDDELERVAVGPLRNNETGKRETAEDVRAQARIVQVARAQGWATQ